MNFRIGFGYDVHQLVKDRKLILGGVEIKSVLGSLAHSDGDVLLHAISDALLGSLALGDIGTHFPDSDQKYKNIDSTLLLRKVYEIILSYNYIIGNIDSTICLQSPKLSPYIPEMREKIGETLQTSIDNISVKATTTENLGFVGKQQGISAYANVILMKDVAEAKFI